MGPRKRQRPRKQVVAGSKAAKKAAAKPPASKPAKSVATKPAAAKDIKTAPTKPTAPKPAKTALTKRAADIEPQKQSRRIRGLSPEYSRKTSPGQKPVAQQGEPAAQEHADSPPAIAATSAPDLGPKPDAKSKQRREENSPSDPVRNSAGGNTLVVDAEGEPQDAEEVQPDTGNPGEEDVQSEAGASSVLSVAAQPVFIDPTERWVMENTMAQQIADLERVLGSLKAQQALQSAVRISAQDAAQMMLQNSGKKGSKRGSVPRTNNGSSIKDGGSIKSAYRSSGFLDMLENGAHGVQLFMGDDSDKKGPDDTSTAFLEKLKEKSYDPSADERYKAEVLKVKLKKLKGKNERNVVHALHDLVCPAAEDLAALTHGDDTLQKIYEDLVDQWDEPWTRASRPLPGLSAPQPDYCVGFARKAFEEEQWSLLGRFSSITTAATSSMHFPFLTCEAKSSKDNICYADNQNANNMMVAIAAAVKLFREAKMETSVHRRVLAFSVSYDNKDVSLNAYYPVIAGARTEIYRTNIFEFRISPGAPQTWWSWHFVRNIYEVWAPQHLEHLRSAIVALRMTVSLERRRDMATPTPSESANTALQQLELQSPAPAAAQSDNRSERSNPGRVKRAETAPPAGDPKRVKVK